MEIAGYTVMKRLATGGMAEVLLANRDARLVAVKRILPHLWGCAEMVRLFEVEARTALRLCHPNIVRAESFTRIQGGSVLAMEYLPGGDLRAHLGRGHAPLAPALVAVVAEAIAAALGHVHALGLVHGDVSPSNILVDHDGRVKLCDFGVAATPGRAIARGKRGYAAPEQRRGGNVDGRVDLYALGVVACELATGRRFQAKSPLDAVAPDLAAVLAPALEVDPGMRYPDAAAMLAELGRIGNGATHDDVGAELRRRAVPGVDDVAPERDDATVRMSTPRRKRRGRAYGLYALAAAASAVAAAAALVIRAGR